MKKIIILAGVFVLVICFNLGTQPLARAEKDDIKLKTFVHYPKEPGKPTQVSKCTPTANDQVNDYLVAGWQMPVNGMSYKLNYSTKPKNLSNTDVQNAIFNSFASWSAADSNQIFNYTGTSTAKTPRYDGSNVILWKSISSSAIAITYVWYNISTGQLVESDTAFNSRYKWSISIPTAGDCGGATGTYDLQNIGTHEFGHWAGLDDLYASIDKDLTMYGYGETTELKKDSLGLGDISGVNAIAP